MKKFKTNILILTIVSFAIGCQNKPDQLIGKWKAISVIGPYSYVTNPPPSVLYPNSVRSKYGAHGRSNTGDLFYLAQEENAVIEFKKDKTVKTTLFYANFGEKIYEYYPNIDTLKVKFIGKVTSVMPTGEQILYDGRLTFIDDKTLKWELSESRIITLKKEE